MLNPEELETPAEGPLDPDPVTPCEDCPDPGDVDLSAGEAATLEALGRMIPTLEEILAAVTTDRERLGRLEAKIDAMLAVFEQLAAFFEQMRGGGGGILGRLLGLGGGREDGNIGG